MGQDLIRTDRETHVAHRAPEPADDWSPAMADTGIPATPPPGAPSEPLTKVGGVTAAVTAVIALLVSFGLELSHAQVIAILGVVAVLAPIVTTTWGRLRVWSPQSVRQLVQQVRAEERGRHRAPDTTNTDVRIIRAEDDL